MSMETQDEIEIVDSKEVKPSTSGQICFPSENKYSHIKNKQIRSQQYQKDKRQKKKVGFIFTLIITV